MFLSGYESVYTGFNLTEFNAVRDLFDAHKIDYRYTLNDRQNKFLAPGRGTIRGSFGTLGTDLSASCQYEIKVAAKDVSRARSLLSHALFH